MGYSGRLGAAKALGAIAAPPPVKQLVRLVFYAVLAGLVGVLLLVATATVPVLFGYHTYTIDGGSMEPSLHKGSVAVTSPTSPRALRIGDIIAWRASPENSPVLHRIVDIKNVDGQLSFVTQGDENGTPDPTPVTLAGPGDRVVYGVPYAGYVLDFAKSTTGRLLLIGAPLALLVALVFREGSHVAERRERHEVQPGVEHQPAPVPSAAIVTMPAPAEVLDFPGGRIATAILRATAASATAGPPPLVHEPLTQVGPRTDNTGLPAFLIHQLRGQLPLNQWASSSPVRRRLADHLSNEAGPAHQARAA